MYRFIIVFFIMTTSVAKAQEFSQVEGVINFYYTPKQYKYDTTSAMYCLDSIRFFHNNRVEPVFGELTQREYFLEWEEKGIIECKNIIKSFRGIEHYCKNPLENYYHLGGEIYHPIIEKNRIVISFSMTAKAVRVFTSKSPNEIDSLLLWKESLMQEFFDAEKVYPCEPILNTDNYLVFVEIIETSKFDYP